MNRQNPARYSNRVEDRAANVARVVAMTAVQPATISECLTAIHNWSCSHIASNQRVEKPLSGKAMIVPSLKAKSGRISSHRI